MKSLGIKDISLFLVIAFISGAGWILVPSQVVKTPLMFSLSYRFILSSFLILSIAVIRKEKIFDKSILGLVLFQGILMFPLNYYFSYTACKYSPSGLVGLISSLAILPAYFIGITLKKYPLKLSNLFALSLTVLGMFLINRKEIAGYNHNSLGIVFAVLGDCSSAIALAIVPYLKRKTPVTVLGITGQSMLVGGVISFLIGYGQHQEIILHLEKNYLISLLILSLLTPIVFVAFYYFSNKRGIVFASYVWVIAPLFSLIASSFVNEYRPGLFDGIGIGLVIFSCLWFNKNLSQYSAFSLQPTIMLLINQLIKLRGKNYARNHRR